MNIVLLVSPEMKQRYVADELSAVANIVGIVVERRYQSGARWKTFFKQYGPAPAAIVKNLILKMLLSRYETKPWRRAERHFLKSGLPPAWPSTAAVIEFPSINDPAVAEKVRAWKPDLIVVFGTSLVGKQLLEIPKTAIINVHTGISPYYRGGQCSFWALYNREPEYIGVTIHRITGGIDSGDIIFTHALPLKGDDTHAEIEARLCILGTALAKEAIRSFQKGDVNAVKQWTKGNLFLGRMYTLEKRWELAGRMKRGLMRELCAQKGNVTVKTFPPKDFNYHDQEYC